MLWCSHCGRSCSSYVTDTSVSCGECGKILVDLTHRKKTSKRTNKEVTSKNRSFTRAVGQGQKPRQDEHSTS